MDPKLESFLIPYKKAIAQQESEPQNQMFDKFRVPEKFRHLIEQADNESNIPTDDNRLVKKLLFIWIVLMGVLCIVWYGFNLIRIDSYYRDKLRETCDGWTSTLNHVFKKWMRRSKNGDQVLITEDASDGEEELLFDRRKHKNRNNKV